MRDGAALRRAPPAHRQPDLARGRADRGELHRGFRRHAAAAAAERAADAACQGRVRRPCRHLAADRAVRRAWHQGDVLHAGAYLRTLSTGAAGGGTQRPRDRRPHVGAPRAEGPGAGARPSAEDRARAGGDHRSPAGRHSQRAHAGAAAAGGFIYISHELGRSSAVLSARCRRRERDAQPAVPLCDRRRDVLQLRLAGQRQRGAADHRSGPGVRPVVGGVLAAVPRRRLPQHRACIRSCPAGRCASR